MHDPMVVAFDIRRPWPKRSRSYDAKPGRPRWRIGRSAFWTVIGRGYYWPSLITIWHVEPGGHDALTVCKYRSRWRWHIWHWHIQLHPYQRARRALLTRCEERGRKGSPNHSHQWNRERGPWWRGERGLYHSECSSLVHLRRMREGDEALIRALVAEIRVRSDESEREVVDRLTHYSSPLDHHHSSRIQRVMGYDRDDNYRLTKADTP